MQELFDSIKYVKVKNRSIAVPHSYRIIYKVTQILMIIKNCCTRRKGCSIEKLQIISDAILSEKSFERLKKFIDGSNNFIVVRFDPVVNRAISYAISEELIIMQKNKLYRLTQKGKKYIESINSDMDIYRHEKSIMSEISCFLTEEKIKELMSDWRFKHVEN